MKKEFRKTSIKKILLKLLLVLYLIQLNSSRLNGLFIINNESAKSSAMGSSLSAFSKASNLLLSGKNQRELNMCFTCSRLYNIEGLEVYSFDLHFTLKYFSLILEAHSSGFNLYREMNIKAGFLFKLFDFACLGFTVNRQSLLLSDIGEEHRFSLDMITALSVRKNFLISLILQNIGSPQFGYYEKDKLEEKLNLELKWKISTELDLFFKIRDFNETSFRMGFDYKIHKGFFVRCGFSDNPNFFTLGFGIEFKNYQIDYGFKNSLDDLGSTHFISLNFRLKTSDNPIVSKTPAWSGYSSNGKININKADRKILLKLRGISKTLADRIISYRRFRNKFRHIREICRVRGIAYSKYRRIMKYIAVDENGSRFLPFKNINKSARSLNSITMRQLVKIGISPLTARNIVLFLKAGGLFKKYEDLNHVPGIDKKSIGIIKKIFFTTLSQNKKQLKK